MPLTAFRLEAEDRPENAVRRSPRQDPSRSAAAKRRQKPGAGPDGPLPPVGWYDGSDIG